MATRLVGASIWDQELYDQFTHHAEHEAAVIAEYRRLAEETTSPDVRYLLDLIIDDELRHHQVVDELARTVRSNAATGDGTAPVPALAFRHPDAPALRDASRRFLALERADLRQLRRLRRRLRRRRDTSLRPLLARIMLADTQKHVMILRFVLRRLHQER